MANTFVGGVHPYDGKDITRDCAVRDFRPTGEICLLLSQHIGAPARSIVSKGDRVLRFQQVAEAGGFVSANIYSSVSGVVKGIEKRRTPTGDMADAIIIENDGQFEEMPLSAPGGRSGSGDAGADDAGKANSGVGDAGSGGALSSDEILEAVKKAGIVGMGGAGFPTHVKLSPREPDKIEYIIANCAECEPYLTSDHRMMLEQGEEILGGIKTVVSLFKNARGIIAIEDNKPDCIAHMKELCQGVDGIEVMELETKYPQGSERQLIYAVTGRSVNSTMLPADVGCIVNNADTMIAIYRAVTLGEPLVDRIVTVTGDAVRRPANYRVPIGCHMSELLTDAGAFEEIRDDVGNVTYGDLIAEKIVSGGPMMGFALFDTEAVITKTSSALLCIKHDTVAAEKSTACINCGLCVEACPSGILPTRLAAFSDHGDEEQFVKYHGLECMECGCCSYVCPAKRQLTQSIKGMRKEILAKRKRQAAKS